MAELPSDVILSVALRLPVKSVGRFRCTSKIWQNLLSSDQFVKSHLNHQLLCEEDDKKVLLFDTNPMCASYSPDKIAYTIVGKKQLFRGIVGVPALVMEKVRFLSTSAIEILGAGHGFILLVDKTEGKLFFFNPTTLTRSQSLDFPLSSTELKRGNVYGLWYDHINDDYKIILASDYRKRNSLFIYSTKTGVWKKANIGKPLKYYYFLHRNSCGLFINGAVHWWAQGLSSQWLILAFDANTEKLEEIMPPPECENFSLTLDVYQGCLCIFERVNAIGCQPWIMKEYGSQHSWTKIYMIGNPERNWFKAQKEMLLTNLDSLFEYNFKDKTLMQVVPRKESYRFLQGCTFTESLLCPSFNVPQ